MVDERISMEHWLSDTDRGKPCYWEKHTVRPYASLSTTKPTRNELGSNLHLRSDKQLANDLSKANVHTSDHNDMNVLCFCNNKRFGMFGKKRKAYIQH